MTMKVQSILFDRNLWTQQKAKKWLMNHDYIYPKIDITENFFRFRQKVPDKNKRYRTINIGRGIEFVLMF